MRNLGHLNNEELGYIDVEMPKYVNKEAGQGPLKPSPDYNPEIAYVYVVKEWLPVVGYSMRKGSWEPVTQKVPSHVRRIYNDVEVCGDGHDGHVHWVCELAEIGNPKTILGYDLGLETFSETSLPADKNGILYLSYAIGVLAYNRLAVYDPIAEKVKLSNIRVVGSTKIVQYMDSLVWIVPSRSETNCSSIFSLQI
ncbi:hypothetical protein Tco_0887954 [Tanacetum coccineum]